MGVSMGVARVRVRERLGRAALTALLFGSVVTGVVVGTGEVVPAHAEANVAGVNLNTTNRFQAFVDVGENLDVHFAKVIDGGTGSGVVVTVTRPSGGGAAIAPCAVSAAAPAGTACAFANLTATVAGIWNIDFAQTGGDHFTWTINVQDVSVTQPGRVFSERYSPVQSAGTANLPLWYLSPEGYLYKAEFDDFNGVNSIFDGDATGNRLKGTCVSAYVSFDTGGPNSDLATYDGPAGAGVCGDPFKIFFAQPAADLPLNAIRPDGSSTWLTTPIVPPSVSGLVFTPDDNVDQSGVLSMNVVGFTGQATLSVDGDNDGLFTGVGDDRDIAVFIAADPNTGVATVVFDGENALGAAIPADQPIGLQVSIDRAGEAHFVNGDVERRAGGIEITRLNGPPGPATKTVYWDDRLLTAAGRCSTTSVLNGTAGVDSTGGVHRWTTTGCVPSSGNVNNGVNGSWGDVRNIDDWTYVPVNAVSPALAVADRSYTIAKTSSPGAGTPLAPGDLVTYNITITNTGTGALENVTLTDDLTDVLDDAPGALTPVVVNSVLNGQPEAGTASVVGNVLTLSDATLPAGSVTTVSYIVTVPGTPPVVGADLVNKISSVESTNCRPPVTVNPSAPGYDADCTTVHVIENPALSIVKSTDATVIPTLGDDVDYTFLVTNIGNVAMANITVTDPNLVVSPIVCSPGPVAPGSAVTCTGTHIVVQLDLDNANITNTATATGEPPSGPPIDPVPSNQVVIPLPPTPDLTIVKSSSTTSFDHVGQVVPYTFTVVNTGNVTFTTFSVTDPNATGIICPAVSLAPGANAICANGTHTVIQADLDAGQIVNTATVNGTPSSGTFNPKLSNEIVIPAFLAPSLSITKSTTTTTLTLGQTVPYDFLVANTGNVVMNAIVVVDPQVTGMSCPFTTLAPSATMTCTAGHLVVQADIDEGELVNTATVGGTPGPPGSVPIVPVPSNKVTISSDPNPALSILKSTTAVNYAAVGDVLAYSFLVTNIGNQTMTDVTVTDPVTDAAPVCPAGPLAPGLNITCTGSHTVTQEDLDDGEVVNTAEVTGDDPDGNPIPPVPSNVVVVPAIQSPLLSIFKASPTPTITTIGQVVPYTFVVANLGNVTIIDLVVTDPNTEGVTCMETTVVPADSTTCTGNHTVTQADLDAGSVINTASVVGNLPTGGPIPPTPSNQVTIPAVQSPSITIVKASSTTTIITVGQVVPYTFEVTNTGNVTLSDIVVTDGLISEIVCPLSTLASAASMSCTGSYTVSGADLDAGEIVNTATVDATPPSGTPLTPLTSNTVTIPAVQSPSLSIVKSTTTTGVPVAGGTIDYSFLVTNTGNVTLTNVTVSDSKIPAVHCPKTTLAAGESMTCTGTYVVTAADAAAGRVENTASVVGTPPGGTPTAPVVSNGVVSAVAATPPTAPPTTPTVPSSGDLPATGTDTMSILRDVLLLLLVGAGLVIISRRRIARHPRQR